MNPAYRVYRWGMIRAGLLIGFLIYEPQLRIGRRRHDGTCDGCGCKPDRYFEERLDSPDREHTSTLDHVRKMTNAEYERVCIVCGAEREADD